MKTSLLLFFNSFLLIKGLKSQLSQFAPITLEAPAITPGSKPILSTPASFDRMELMKCYPETAKAYFLPAPPSAPIVTVLDPRSMDMVSNFKPTTREMSSNTPVPSSSVINEVRLLPPPVPVLPDLIDEVPFLVQDRFSRLAESDVNVCDACGLVPKLPIYNFDQDLLNGFLAGLGL